jgi:predicted TIM-barrel fold metal-dependent hydrolase
VTRLLLVSSDCHAAPPPQLYREYLDPALRPTYDAYLAQPQRLERRIAETVGLDLRSAQIVQTSDGRPAGLTSHWDAALRLRELERDGIAAEVIFPQPGGLTGPPFYPFGHAFDPERLELAQAGARAYNRWLVDFCKGSPHPDRHVGLALIADVGDVAAVVRELEWARDAGLRGVVLRSQPLGQPLWHHPRYEPIWAACAALDLPVHTHGGEGPELGDVPGSRAVYFTEITWYAHRLLWLLIWSGALERHPRLRLVFTEQFADWIPDVLHRMDAQFEGAVASTTLHHGLSLRPSEYWARQCYVGSSLMTRRECERRHQIGVPTIMWGSDFPHAEGTWPNTARRLHEAFDGVPEAELRPMLGETAARVYGLDLAALAPLAERIGPDPAEFAAPPGGTRP